MSMPSREMAAALGGGQVDLHAADHLPPSPDHQPAPGYWEPDVPDRRYFYVGLVLVAIVIVLVFVL